MISVIIPVFNSGLFLKEAISSVRNSVGSFSQIIIVDDGSTDHQTLNYLDSLSGSDILVLRKNNGGPASARNFGASHAIGEFLFFLDSDNLLKPKYLSKAYLAMLEDDTVGVVYSRANFFGETSITESRFETRSFDFDALLSGNFIDMCSLVRREAFEEVGGFDEHRDLIGWEDADLWVRLAQTQFRFKFLDEVLFDYRVRSDSLMGISDLRRRERMLKYFGSKHGLIIHKKYRQYYRIMDQIQKNPFSYFLRILYYKYIKRKPFIK